MKKGKVIRVENDIVTIGMNNGSIKEVRRCDLGFDPVLGDLVEIFEDEDQIIVTKAKKEPENHNDAGININMTNSINNASDVAAGNGKKVVNKVAYCLLALFLGGFGVHKCLMILSMILIISKRKSFVIADRFLYMIRSRQKKISQNI